MELRAAAVEHPVEPVEPVVAPVDKGSSPSEVQKPCVFFSGACRQRAEKSAVMLYSEVMM